MNAIEIGKRIKQRREELHLTQEDLGTPLGFNKSTIQRYESGKIRKIKLPVLESMAKVLRVEPNWLALKDEDNSEPQITLPRQTSEHIPLSHTQQQILSNCQQLNETGQKKILDFSNDLVDTGKYTDFAREPGARIAAYGATETEEEIQPPIEEITT